MILAGSYTSASLPSHFVMLKWNRSSVLRKGTVVCFHTSEPAPGTRPALWERLLTLGREVDPAQASPRRGRAL